MLEIGILWRAAYRECAARVPVALVVLLAVVAVSWGVALSPTWIQLDPRSSVMTNHGAAREQWVSASAK